MKASRIHLAAVAASLLNLSFAPQESVGQRFSMLTERYGIVTDADLDEESARCHETETFPNGDPCLNYWQCLPIREVFMDCEEGDVDEVLGRVGSAVFWIQSGEEFHNYMTRRNYDMETCHDYLQEWKQVTDGEDVVCLSGEFIEKGSYEGDAFTPAGTHSFWVIDRMKSRRGEWSYFDRGEPVNE